MDAVSSPELSSAHRRLLALVGVWRGSEEMFATQWAPAGTATAEVETTAEFGGLFVIQRYRQIRGEKESFASRNVFGFDQSDSLVKMFAFDTMGYFPAAPSVGAWDGDRLVLERASPRGCARISYSIEGADEYRTHLQFRPAAARDWQDMAKGTFRRASSNSATY